MPMTMTQKILAAHAGLPEVKAGQIFQRMADLEHPQDAARKSPAGIDRRTGVLVLQRPFASHTQARSAEIVTRGLPGTFNIQRHIDEARYPLVEGGAMIEVQHHLALPRLPDLAATGSPVSHGRSSSRSANGLAASGASGSGVGGKPRTGGNWVASWCATMA